jgi:predicted ATPase
MRLDGIPLALELAAARGRTVPIDVLAERLDQRFRLFTDGDRTAVPRQQTLAATIGWSHDLLTDEERQLFRRLSVFAGGWTLPPRRAAFSDLYQRRAAPSAG